MLADYGNNTLLTPSRSATHWEAELNEVQCIICKHNEDKDSLLDLLVLK